MTRASGTPDGQREQGGRGQQPDEQVSRATRRRWPPACPELVLPSAQRSLVDPAFRGGARLRGLGEPAEHPGDQRPGGDGDLDGGRSAAPQLGSASIAALVTASTPRCQPARVAAAPGWPASGHAPGPIAAAPVARSAATSMSSGGRAGGLLGDVRGAFPGVHGHAAVQDQRGKEDHRDGEDHGEHRDRTPLAGPSQRSPRPDAASPGSASARARHMKGSSGATAWPVKTRGRAEAEQPERAHVHVAGHRRGHVLARQRPAGPPPGSRPTWACTLPARTSWWRPGRPGPPAARPGRPGWRGRASDAARAASRAAPSMWPCASTTRPPAPTSSSSRTSPGATTASSTDMDRAPAHAGPAASEPRCPRIIRSRFWPGGRKHSTGPPAVAEMVRCSPKKREHRIAQRAAHGDVTHSVRGFPEASR